MRPLLAIGCSLLLTASASAQLALYDAGAAGNPPIAPDPVSMGWDVSTFGQVGLNPISPDGASGLNAWEIADSSSSDRASYYVDVPSLPAYFDFSITLRMTASDADYGIFFQVQDGFTLIDDNWVVGLRIVGPDVIATQKGWSGQTVQFVCEGGALGYHTYSIRKAPGFLAAFVYDGTVLGEMVSDAPGIFFNGGVRWGTGWWSDALFGRARVNRVEFRDLGSPVGNTIACGGTVPNSTGQPATIDSHGSTTLGGAGFALSVAQLPANKFGYFLLSSATASILPPNSQGRLCLAPQGLGRFNRAGEVLNSGPIGRFFLDVDTLDVPTSPAGPLPPGTMYFQAWYRDNNPTSTSNFSEAIGIVFQ
jgi:hypothetical protein